MQQGKLVDMGHQLKAVRAKRKGALSQCIHRHKNDDFVVHLGAVVDEGTIDTRSPTFMLAEYSGPVLPDLLLYMASRRQIGDNPRQPPVQVAAPCDACLTVLHSSSKAQRQFLTTFAWLEIGCHPSISTVYRRALLAFIAANV